MTELLPKGDKVEIRLDEETVSVPDGKVWRVVVGVESSGTDIQNPSGFDAIQLSEFDDYDSVAEMTIHEGWQISARGEAGILGWEFNYSE